MSIFKPNSPGKLNIQIGPWGGNVMMKIGDQAFYQSAEAARFMATHLNRVAAMVEVNNRKKEIDIEAHEATAIPGA